MEYYEYKYHTKLQVNGPWSLQQKVLSLSLELCIVYFLTD